MLIDGNCPFSRSCLSRTPPTSVDSCSGFAWPIRNAPSKSSPRLSNSVKCSPIIEFFGFVRRSCNNSWYHIFVVPRVDCECPCYPPNTRWSRSWGNMWSSGFEKWGQGCCRCLPHAWARQTAGRAGEISFHRITIGYITLNMFVVKNPSQLRPLWTWQRHKGLRIKPITLHRWCVARAGILDIINSRSKRGISYVVIWCGSKPTTMEYLFQPLHP